MPLRIEDYALIGDCETAALVGRDGSIDWLCWPRFDSGACFAALLGTPDHGRWLIAPTETAPRVRRRYRPGTLILETEFATAEGAVTLVDFMPPRGSASDVVRIVVGKSGTVEMALELVLRFDHGSVVPWVRRLEDKTLAAIAGPDMVVLRTPVAHHGKDLRTVGTFTVRAGDRVPFVLTYGASHEALPQPIDPEAALTDTEGWWQEWTSRYKEDGRWADEVVRSLITLKALTYRPTGGIVAAPTTSLPEQLGGPRNWDYRFCWLRDATFSLLALMNAGYYDEAKAWRDWLLRAVAGSPAELQIMYGLAGERRLTEWDVPWLPGYEGARPVRIGNAACRQFQLDVYGEMMDALHQGRVGGLEESAAAWQLQRAVMSHIEEVWTRPDQGIWEMRGPPRDFTYSKVMAWVAADRAVKSAERFKLEGPVERWRALRDRIHREVCARAWDDRRGSFVQSYGSDELDAALLLMPIVGFLPPHDPRLKGTVEAIERELVMDGLVRRYRNSDSDDGLPGGEGVFLACSFWLADNLVLLGRREDARSLFERLLELRNDVGLLAEEYDPNAKRQVGNFPQAFSHIALVNTAHNLERGERAKSQRAEGAHDKPQQTARKGSGEKVI